MTPTPLARVLGGIIASAAVGFTLGVVISMASQGRIHANIALDIVFGALAVALSVVALRAAWHDQQEHRALQRRKATLAKLQRDKGGVR